MAQFTVAIIGDAGVGKTTFVQALNMSEFEPCYFPTVDCEERLVNRFNICVLDFGGQEKFQGAMTKLDKADAVIVMFDVTSRRTYNNLSKWLKQVKPDVPLVVAGNKIDVSERKVHDEDIPYIGISSKTRDNVDLVLKLVM